jgi:hypothetical protein
MGILKVNSAGRFQTFEFHFCNLMFFQIQATVFCKNGGDYPCECDVPPHGLGWASHHPSAKWRGIFEAKASHLQAQNQGLVDLPVEQKQKAQQSAKRRAK